MLTTLSEHPTDLDREAAIRARPASLSGSGGGVWSMLAVRSHRPLADCCWSDQDSRCSRLLRNAPGSVMWLGQVHRRTRMSASTASVIAGANHTVGSVPPPVIASQIAPMLARSRPCVQANCRGEALGGSSGRAVVRHRRAGRGIGRRLCWRTRLRVRTRHPAFVKVVVEGEVKHVAAGIRQGGADRHDAARWWQTCGAAVMLPVRP